MNKKYWLNGGIIGFLMAWALILFSALNTWDTGYGKFINYRISEAVIFSPDDGLYYLHNIGFFFKLWLDYWFLVPIIFYTLVGLIIGWIYGKIKKS